jgi:hypothetical protein
MPRVRDTQLMRQIHLGRGECLACRSTERLALHHIVGRGQLGGDVEANLVFLCGKCHTALHGNPYVAEGARRDADWVRRRIGRNLTVANIAYVGEQLGDEAAAEFLSRHYYWGEQ